jgi:hypothetical protein
MTKRIALNLAALAVVFGGSVSLSATAEAAVAPGGGSCCDQTSTTCYLNLGDGIVVQQSGARAC